MTYRRSRVRVPPCPPGAFISSKVIIVTGPAGAGKTSACKLFAETTKGTWAFLAQDDIRQLIKAGYDGSPDNWTETTWLQWNVSTTLLGQMAKTYQDSGINCVIECFAPFERWPQWEAAFADVDYQLVVLNTAEVDTILARNAKRTGEARLPDELIGEFHGWFEGFHDIKNAIFIDTTHRSPIQVAKVLGKLA